ncbi:peroxynitrite isomerase THAP4 [Ixodes scapularis]
MPNRCCVPHCDYRVRLPRSLYCDENISLHRLPKNPKKQRLWLEAIKLERPVKLQFARVCSRHFLQDDFLKKIVSGKKVLCDDAVPSVFNRPPSQRQTSSFAVERLDLSSEQMESVAEAPTALTSEPDGADFSPKLTTAEEAAIVADLHSYAKNYISMPQDGGAASSAHRQPEPPTAADSSCEQLNVATADPSDGTTPNDVEPIEDLQLYSIKLIQMLRNAAATNPGKLQCGNATDDDGPPSEGNRRSDCSDDVHPTHEDTATSSHQCYEDTPTSPPRSDEYAVTSPNRHYEDSATSPLRYTDDAASENASGVASEDECQEGEAEELEKMRRKLQYEKHRVAWLKSTLTKRDERVEELQRECLGLKKEAIGLRQQVLLLEAQQRHRTWESAKVTTPIVSRIVLTCCKCRDAT